MFLSETRDVYLVSVYACDLSNCMSRELDAPAALLNVMDFCLFLFYSRLIRPCNLLIFFNFFFSLSIFLNVL